MPHKHKRKRDDDLSNFDLAPTTRAKPLAAYNKASLFSTDQDGSSKTNKRRKPDVNRSKKTQDDTPKAFARMMAWQATGKKPNGLDDGNSTKSSKKRKAPASKEVKFANPDAEAGNTTTSSKGQPTPLKIHPSESLSTFSQRVDQSLPLTNLPQNSRQTNPSTLPQTLRDQLTKSQRTTKHNRRLQRLQSDWRATESKLRTAKQEALEDDFERLTEEQQLWSDVNRAKSNQKGKKLKTKKKSHSADNNNIDDGFNLDIDGDDDIWKGLEKKRTQQKNLQDVVKEPPTLKPIKKRLKSRPDDFGFLDHHDHDHHLNNNAGDDDNFVRIGAVWADVANVPGARGAEKKSLKRREDLNQARQSVIEGYRRMQKDNKKGGVHGERSRLSGVIMTS